MAEIASAFVSLLPSARGFGPKLSSEISSDVNRSGKSAGATFGKVFAAAAAVGIGAKAFSFLKDGVAGASDLQESTTKIGAIFGSSAKDVQKFAGKGAGALGQTQLEVLNASATFGTFGKAAGLAGGDLSKFSTDFAGLSTDLASFYNTSPEQAVEAIGAALRGESEPIRSYGVLLDDATLRNEALRLGLVKTTKTALTPQQKVLAAQSAIYKQTKDAQGDFQRTSGGLANQQRILSAQWSDMKTNLGKALLPAITGIVTGLNKFMGPAIATAGDLFDKAKVKVGPLADAIKSFFSGLDVSTLVAAAKVALAVMFPLVGAFVAFRPQIMEVVSYLRDKLAPVFAQVGDIIKALIPVLANLGIFFYTKILPAVVDIVKAIGTRLKPVFEQVVTTFQTSVLPTLQKLIEKFKENLPAIKNVVSFVVRFVGALFKVAAAILGKVLPPLIRFAGFLFRNVVPAVAAVIGKVVRIVSAIIDFGKRVAAFVGGAKQRFGEFRTAAATAFDAAKTIISRAINNARQAVANTLTKIVDFFRKLPGRIIGAIGDLGTQLYDFAKEAAGKLGRGLVDGIKGSAGAVKGAASDVVGGIKGLLPGSPIKEGPLKSWNRGGAGKRLMGLLASGIRSSGSKAVGEAARVTAGIDKVIGSSASFGNAAASIRPPLVESTTPSRRTVDQIRGQQQRVARGVQLGQVAGSTSAAQGGLSMTIEQVVAHDYQDFMGQTQRRAQRTAMDGVRRQVVNGQ